MPRAVVTLPIEAVEEAQVVVTREAVEEAQVVVTREAVEEAGATLQLKIQDSPPAPSVVQAEMATQLRIVTVDVKSAKLMIMQLATVLTHRTIAVERKKGTT